MGLLADLAKALYEAKMRNKPQTEKAEESHSYKIDLQKINEKHELKKERELEAMLWEHKLEYERLKAKGFSDYDISKMIGITEKGVKILSKQKLWC